jgi:Flp pilus assembly protein TadG
VTSRGQALIELAVCMPVVLLLGLGAAGVVEVADASSGLRAATEAAVDAASRAPDARLARDLAHERFASVVAAYPIKSPTFSLVEYGFARGSTLTGTATGVVDLGWEAMSFLPAAVDLRATATMRIEPWRTHS